MSISVNFYLTKIRSLRDTKIWQYRYCLEDACSANYSLEIEGAF